VEAEGFVQRFVVDEDREQGEDVEEMGLYKSTKVTLHYMKSSPEKYQTVL
jgi:hypothetical protein